MKRLMTTLMALGAAWTVSAETILLECEQFKNLGGWSIDSQFIDEMGSSYLLAHGLGKACAAAHDYHIGGQLLGAVLSGGNGHVFQGFHITAGLGNGIGHSGYNALAGHGSAGDGVHAWFSSWILLLF